MNGGGGGTEEVDGDGDGEVVDGMEREAGGHIFETFLLRD